MDDTPLLNEENEVNEEIQVGEEDAPSDTSSVPVDNSSSISSEDFNLLMEKIDHTNSMIAEITLHDKADFEFQFTSGVFNTFTNSVSAVCLFVFVITYFLKR